MANPIRTGLKNLHCINTVFCGDQIEATWANAVRDLGQSGFERGDTVLSLRSTTEGTIRIPIVGFCWNMIQDYGTNPNRLIFWDWDLNEIRFQPAFPYYHNNLSLYQGNVGTDPIISNQGTYVEDNGIQGYQHIIADFENAGYNKAQIIARVRRGYREYMSTNIPTKPISAIDVFEFKESGGAGLGYRQHFQCWYMQENPSGSMFPPLKTLIFDDTDCPLQTEVKIVKEIILPLTPIAGETTLDWIIFAVWYNAPFLGYSPANSKPMYFVMATDYLDYETDHCDGLISINCKLFKTC